MSEIADRIHELDRKRPEVFAPDQMALAGAFIEIRHDGDIRIARGYVRPEDAKQLKPDPDDLTAKAKPAAKSGLSRSLMTDLTAHRTAAIAALLAENPRVALAAIVHGMGLSTFYDDRFSAALGFGITGTNWPQDFRKPGNSRALDQIEKSRKTWRETLPRKAEFWNWCLAADQKTLLSLLAFFAALSARHTDGLAAPLGLDMNAWFQPTAGNFFCRIGKDEIIKAVREATGKHPSPAQEKLKKSELAAFAERAVLDTGWLPKPLRAPATGAKKPRNKAA